MWLKVVEHLCSKCEALSSNPSTEREREREREKERQRDRDREREGGGYFRLTVLEAPGHD
jgi:hypothetical protein